MKGCSQPLRVQHNMKESGTELHSSYGHIFQPRLSLFTADLNLLNQANVPATVCLQAQLVELTETIMSASKQLVQHAELVDGNGRSLSFDDVGRACGRLHRR